MDLSEIRARIDKELYILFPRTPSDAWLQQQFGHMSFAFHKETWTKTIAEPFLNFLERGGKRIRPTFVVLVGSCFKNTDQLYTFATIPEILHNGTLIIDDIEDHSHTRRGLPTLHLMYNQSQVINTGNFVYFYPLSIIRRSSLSPEKKTALYNLIQQEFTNLHLGQAMDIYWSENNKRDVKIEEYLQMCVYKTGCLFALSTALGCILADVPEETTHKLMQAGEDFGVGFQVNDDVANVKAELDHSNWHGKKDMYSDLREGKTTYLTALALERATPKEKELMIRILAAKTENVDELKKVVDIMEKYDVLTPAKELAIQLMQRSYDAYNVLLPDSQSKEILLSLITKGMKGKE